MTQHEKTRTFEKPAVSLNRSTKLVVGQAWRNPQQLCSVGPNGFLDQAREPRMGKRIGTRCPFSPADAERVAVGPPRVEPRVSILLQDRPDALVPLAFLEQLFQSISIQVRERVRGGFAVLDGLADHVASPLIRLAQCRGDLVGRYVVADVGQAEGDAALPPLVEDHCAWVRRHDLTFSPAYDGAQNTLNFLAMFGANIEAILLQAEKLVVERTAMMFIFLQNRRVVPREEPEYHAEIPVMVFPV